MWQSDVYQAYFKRKLLWRFVILITGITQSFHFFEFSGGDPRILGIYENQKYTNQNNYHYVNITYDSPNSVYLWKNRANRVYKIDPIAKQNELRVDENVDYYNSANWKIAKVDNEALMVLIMSYRERWIALAKYIVSLYNLIHSTTINGAYNA